MKDLNQKSRLDNQNARQALLKQGIQLVTPNTEEITQWHVSIARAAAEMKRQENFSRSLLQQSERLISEFRKRNQ